MAPLQALLLSCALLCAQLGAVQAQVRSWGYQDPSGLEGVYFIPVKVLGESVSGGLAGATHVILNMRDFRKPGIYSIGEDGEVDIRQLAAKNASESILIHARTFASPSAVTSDEPRFVDSELLPWLALDSKDSDTSLTTLYVNIKQNARIEQCTYIQDRRDDNDLARHDPKIVQSLHLGFLITLSFSPLLSPGSGSAQFHLRTSFASPSFAQPEEYWTHAYPIMPTPANETYEEWNPYYLRNEPSHWAPNTTIGDACTNKMYQRYYEESHRGRWIWISVLVVAQVLTLAFVAYKIMGWRRKRSGARSAGTRETGVWEEFGGRAVFEWWKRRGGRAGGTREEESGLWDELEERK